VARDRASTSPPPWDTHTSAVVFAGTVTFSSNRRSDLVN
jgi:hypothetical protein